MKSGLLWVALLAATIAHATDPAPAAASQRVDIRVAQLKPAFLLWRIGVGSKDASLMAENVFQTKADGRRIWRITHLTGAPGDADAEGYDYYDVDATTLRPIVSDMKNPGMRYRIVFDAGQAQWRRVEKEGKAEQRTLALPEHVYPEGPGDTVFLAALPLRKGYTLRYTALDRWREDKLAQRTLRVTGEETLATPAGKFRCYVLEVEAPNGYYSRIWVLADAPHYPVRYEYGRAPDTLVSELQQLAIGR